MLVGEGRSELAPVRQGTTPWTRATNFEEEPTISKQCNVLDETLGENDVQLQCEGLVGLGGCLNPAHHACYDSAKSWYDMEPIGPNTWGG